MTDELTSRQQMLLWALVSRGGSALQKEMKPDVEASDRKRLEQAKLIVVSRQKNRAYLLTMNEESCWAALGARLPSLMTARGNIHDRAILQFVLERMFEFARANDVGLSQIIAARRIVAASDQGDALSDDDAPLRAGKAPEEAIQHQVREAFFALAGRPARNQLRLRALRDRLSSIPRQALDETLLLMREEGSASFSKLANPPDIAAEGDAALTIKDQIFHTVWIEP